MYAIVGAVLVASVLAWQVISNIFLSPLRRIPGPLLAKVSAKWLVFKDLAGDRTLTIHRLHQKYGSVVRIGPQELSFSDPETIKDIYSQQTAFLKAPVYEIMSVKPLGIFSMRDKAEHSQRRRLLSHAFSQANLFDCEPLIQQQIKNLITLLDAGSGKSADVLSLFRLTAFDIVGELFLGQSFGGLNAAQKPEFLHDMDLHFILSGLEGSFSWLYHTLLVLPIPALRHILLARDRIIKYGKASYARYIEQYGRNSGRRDLLTKILTDKTQAEVTMDDRETYTEIANLVFAGTDTTSTTLTYLFWLLAINQHWQIRLREELRENTGSDVQPTYKDLVHLSILDALMNEALRLHPAAPASLPRETPAEGRTLNGIYVPAKVSLQNHLTGEVLIFPRTIVSMQCYTTQRDPNVFPRPNEFLPERWMDPKAVTSLMKLMFMPFSHGSRACLGKNLAIMELKMITAALINLFEVTVSPTMTPVDMMMKDHFLALPKGGKCDLIFTKAG